MIALGSSLVALAALVLTAYLARLNLQHQRLEAHRGRVWERQVDIVPEFLEWLKTDAADGRPPVDSSDPVDYAPRMPVALHARLTAFLPELSEELAKGAPRCR